MPACCRCQHCHGRRDDDARVQGRDEVADPAVQHVDRIGRKGGEPEASSSTIPATWWRYSAANSRVIIPPWEWPTSTSGGPAWIT